MKKQGIILFILGLILCGSVVYAGVFRAYDITYDNTSSNLVDDNNNDVTNIQDAIDVLYDKATSSNDFGVLLWENQDPTSNFVSQTINLDLSNYTHVLIEYTLEIGTTPSYGILAPLNASLLLTNGSSTNRYRSFTIYSNRIEFGSGVQGSTTYNQLLIPIRIYGVNIN